jgi:hypothetical protein
MRLSNQYLCNRHEKIFGIKDGHIRCFPLNLQYEGHNITYVQCIYIVFVPCFAFMIIYKSIIFENNVTYCMYFISVLSVQFSIMSTIS